jgi:hypothetical protein
MSNGAVDSAGANFTRYNCNLRVANGVSDNIVLYSNGSSNFTGNITAGNDITCNGNFHSQYIQNAIDITTATLHATGQSNLNNTFIGTSVAGIYPISLNSNGNITSTSLTSNSLASTGNLNVNVPNQISSIYFNVSGQLITTINSNGLISNSINSNNISSTFNNLNLNAPTGNVINLSNNNLPVVSVNNNGLYCSNINSSGNLVINVPTNNNVINLNNNGNIVCTISNTALTVGFINSNSITSVGYNLCLNCPLNFNISFYVYNALMGSVDGVGLNMNNIKSYDGSNLVLNVPNTAYNIVNTINNVEKFKVSNTYCKIYDNLICDKYNSVANLVLNAPTNNYIKNQINGVDAMIVNGTGVSIANNFTCGFTGIGTGSTISINGNNISITSSSTVTITAPIINLNCAINYGSYSPFQMWT